MFHHIQVCTQPAAEQTVQCKRSMANQLYAKTRHPPRQDTATSHNNHPTPKLSSSELTEVFNNWINVIPIQNWSVVFNQICISKISYGRSWRGNTVEGGREKERSFPPIATTPFLYFNLSLARTSATSSWLTLVQLTFIRLFSHFWLGDHNKAFIWCQFVLGNSTIPCVCLCVCVYVCVCVCHRKIVSRCWARSRPSSYLSFFLPSTISSPLIPWACAAASPRAKITRVIPIFQHCVTRRVETNDVTFQLPDGGKNVKQGLNSQTVPGQMHTK